MAALARDVALFTVFPSLGVVLTGTHHTRDVADPAMGFLAPAIYWYGWAATAAFGALMLGFVAALLPGRWTRHLAGMDMVGSRALDDRVRLSHTSLVSVVTARPRAPNVVIVLVDDMGFGIPSASGGCVNMPTTDRLANGGLRYSQFHTTALLFAMIFIFG